MYRSMDSVLLLLSRFWFLARLFVAHLFDVPYCIRTRQCNVLTVLSPFIVAFVEES